MDYSALTDQQIMDLIGARLRDIRLSRDMSQQALAEASGLSVFTITQTEHGHNVSLKSIIKAFRAMGCLDDIKSIIESGNVEHFEHRHASFSHSDGRGFEKK